MTPDVAMAWSSKQIAEWIEVHRRKVQASNMLRNATIL